MAIIRRDYYKRGNWNAISDQDGQKRKSSDMRMQWDGLWVGIEEFDPKHPQLDLRPRPENPSRYPVRNIEPTIVNITASDLSATVLSSSGVAYQVSSNVLSSAGVSYTVSADVLDSDGDSITVFSYDYDEISATNPNVMFLVPPLTVSQMV